MPEEFAEAYRAAYERALAAQPEGPQHRQEPTPDAASTARREGRQRARTPRSRRSHQRADEPSTRELPREREGSFVGGGLGGPRDDEPPEEATAYERVRDSRWFVPLLLALLAALLVLGAYAVGRAFSGRVDGDAGGATSGASSGDPSVAASQGASKTPQPVSREPAAGGAWGGSVAPVSGLSARTDCTYRTGVDASGARVTYGVDHLTDDVADTTWRCDGSAIGQRIVVDLGRAVPVGEVGLIPGYAKTDDASGADRYAENNRITRVRWTVGTTTVVQELSGSASDRSVRLLRVPRTTASRLTLEVLAVRKGPRDTTAISEITVGRATG